MKMQVDIPKILNILLRRYSLETGIGSREKSTIYILDKFLKQLYKEKK